jgi:ABC-type phosphate/phosphonate transport system substrate-binding protein
MRLVANARMYAVAPAAATAWRTVLEWVVARAGVDAEVIEHLAPAPLAALWAREDLGCAFMCGRPFATAVPRPTLLAAPVANPPAYGGQPIYWTDLVVAAESPVAAPEEAFGGCFAWTSFDSQSGWLAPSAYLARRAKTRSGQLFACAVGPLVTPRAVAVAIAEGRADLGPLDSYAHDLLRRHEPVLAARLRVVASTPQTPIPPLVGAASLAPAVAANLRAALLAVGDAPELASARAALLLSRFASVDPGCYDALADAVPGAEAGRFGIAQDHTGRAD